MNIHVVIVEKRSYCTF